jgi:hypothetical protein
MISGNIGRGRAGTACRAPTELDLGHASVYEEFDAGDEAGVVGGEEGDGFGDFVGGAHAAHGDTADESSFELGCIADDLPKTIDGRSFNGAGADDVDADFAVLEIDRPTAGERAEGGFGSAVDAEGGHAFDGDDGGVENDGTAIDEKRESFLYGEENAFHVYVERFVVVGFGDRSEGSEFAEACVGEEDVDAAFLLFDGGVEAIQIGEICDIALDGGDVFADSFHGGV